MLDRESTLKDKRILKLLSTEFVPVAIDQWYERRLDDVGSKFYQGIAAQGPRSDFNSTTQGFYIATAGGEFLGYNNNRGSQRIRKLMEEAIHGSASKVAKPLPDPVENANARLQMPNGTLIVQINAKVLSGYQKPKNQFEKIFQSSISRDNLWINEAEQNALRSGEFPTSLGLKIARCHLLDNTRGEPSMWSVDEIESFDIDLSDGRITGSAKMQTADGKRGYRCDLRGFLTTDGKSISGFDLVAKGMFWGEGRYTQGAPKGEFPLAVAFRLADPDDAATEVLPQGMKVFGSQYK